MCKSKKTQRETCNLCCHARDYFEMHAMVVTPRSTTSPISVDVGLLKIVGSPSTGVAFTKVVEPPPSMLIATLTWPLSGNPAVGVLENTSAVSLTVNPRPNRSTPSIATRIRFPVLLNAITVRGAISELDSAARIAVAAAATPAEWTTPSCTIVPKPDTAKVTFSVVICGKEDGLERNKTHPDCQHSNHKIILILGRNIKSKIL